jgi:hypothetical protein
MLHMGSSGDSLSESPLLPYHTTPIDVVIPNESANRRRSEESPIKKNYILAQKEIHIICMIPDTHFIV